MQGKEDQNSVQITFDTEIYQYQGSGGNRRKKFLETEFHSKNQEGYKDVSHRICVYMCFNQTYLPLFLESKRKII